MSLTNSRLVSLRYGEHGRFCCEVEAERVLACSAAPRPSMHVVEDAVAACAYPIDFPPLAQAVIPDDQVVLAVDRHAPGSADLVAATWRMLGRRGIVPEHVTVIQPASLVNGNPADPRSGLPEDVRDRVRWKVHDPTNRSDCAYLAATASGERIYLARDVIDADVVISIGEIAYDAVLGYRGTNSVFYPGLSSWEALTRSHGQGHSELEPDDVRPLRQLVDEIGWLLGTQFTIQGIASAEGGVADVLAGAWESVDRRGRQLLAERWLIQLGCRPEIVVAAVDHDAVDHGWAQVGAALATARNLVARGGKIVILSELSAEFGRGLELIGESESPRDALKPLRTQAPPDLIPATQLAHAADWADVYLLSHLPADRVEQVFFVALDSEDDVVHLLERAPGRCVFLEAAQHTYGRVR